MRRKWPGAARVPEGEAGVVLSPHRLCSDAAVSGWGGNGVKRRWTRRPRRAQCEEERGGVELGWAGGAIALSVV